MLTSEVVARLLLVDDDLLVLRSMARALKRAAELDVVVASTVEDALELAAHVDMVITDVHLGSEDGLDLATTLLRSDVRVAAMSAHFTCEMRERAAELGIELIEKPVDADVVLRLMGER